MVIWKYELQCVGEQDIEVPYGTEVLCVQAQGGKPCVWAVVDEKETRKEVRTFLTYGTGHEHAVIDASEYIGTFQLQGGKLVFHVFERRA